MNIGTDEYDKWLSKYRKNTIIYSGTWTYEIREPGSEPVNELLYSYYEARERSDHILKKIVKHKTVYYKEMAKKQEEKKVEMRKQVMKRWKAFDEVSDLNDDMKEEIRKFLKKNIKIVKDKNIMSYATRCVEGEFVEITTGKVEMKCCGVSQTKICSDIKNDAKNKYNEKISAIIQSKVDYYKNKK